jgi:hypothetical protein
VGYEYRTEPNWEAAWQEWVRQNSGTPTLEIWLDETPEPGYTTLARLAELGDRWVVTNLMISMAQPPDVEINGSLWAWSGFVWAGRNEAGVTPHHLRAISLSDIYRQAALARGEGLTGMKRIDDALARLPLRKPGTRPRRTAVEDAKVAAAYVAEVAAEGAEPLYARLGDRLGYSPSTMVDIVKRLRTEGFLTRPAHRGTAGGELTEKAKRLLDEESGSGE